MRTRLGKKNCHGSGVKAVPAVAHKEHSCRRETCRVFFSAAGAGLDDSVLVGNAEADAESQRVWSRGVVDVGGLVLPAPVAAAGGPRAEPDFDVRKCRGGRQRALALRAPATCSGSLRIEPEGGTRGSPPTSGLPGDGRGGPPSACIRLSPTATVACHWSSRGPPEPRAREPLWASCARVVAQECVPRGRVVLRRCAAVATASAGTAGAGPRPRVLRRWALGTARGF